MQSLPICCSLVKRTKKPWIIAERTVTYGTGHKKRAPCRRRGAHFQVAVPKDKFSPPHQRRYRGKLIDGQASLIDLCSGGSSHRAHSRHPSYAEFMDCTFWRTSQAVRQHLWSTWRTRSNGPGFCMIMLLATANRDWQCLRHWPNNKIDLLPLQDAALNVAEKAEPFMKSLCLITPSPKM